MRLIVDTNVLISFFRENPVRDIIMNSALFGLQLFTPEYAISELKNNKSDLTKYSGLLGKDLEFAIMLLGFFIEIKSDDFFVEFKDNSENLSPDLKDAPFFALALKLECGIWSNEPRLKQQKSVEVLSSPDLRKLLLSGEPNK